MNTCQNCGSTIKVAIFRGGEYCSVDCAEALGMRLNPVTMRALTSTEVEILKEAGF